MVPTQRFEHFDVLSAVEVNRPYEVVVDLLFLSDSPAITEGLKKRILSLETALLRTFFTAVVTFSTRGDGYENVT